MVAASAVIATLQLVTGGTKIAYHVVPYRGIHWSRTFWCDGRPPRWIGAKFDRRDKLRWLRLGLQLPNGPSTLWTPFYCLVRSPNHILDLYYADALTSP